MKLWLFELVTNLVPLIIAVGIVYALFVICTG